MGRGTDAVGQERAAPLEELPQPFAARSIKRKSLTAVHEDEVVVEEPWIGGIDLAGRVVNANAKFPGRSAQDVGKCGRSRIAHATVAELGDRNLASLELASRFIDATVDRKKFVLSLELPVGSICQHIGANG